LLTARAHAGFRRNLLQENVMLAETENVQAPPAEDSERVRIIKAVIEDVRPNLQRDGGDCELLGIEGNKVMVRLTGACVFCKLASMTLEGIQSKVVERLGELVRIVPVAGAAKARH
jgi:Fe-S cluster biogenesis protein NfuA